MASTLEILKWVLLVFIAGAIGQLGKMLTNRIIASRKLRDEVKEGVVLPEGTVSQSSPPGGKDELKARKKETKAELKRRKKEAKRERL